HSLRISGFPSSATAGVADTITVTALTNADGFTGYTGTIHFSSSDGLAGLPADYTFTAGDNGTHTFTLGVALKPAGTQSLTVTDTATPSVTGTQSNIDVITASRFVVSGFPSGVTTGTAASFTVSAVDVYGNVVPGYRGTVRFSSSDAAATLPGNYAFT